MPAFTSINKLKCSFLFIIFLAVISCGGKNHDINNVIWNNIDSINGISFYITEYGDGGKNSNITLKYSGYINVGKYVPDTNIQEQHSFDIVIASYSKIVDSICKTLKGRAGFVKINMTDFYSQLFKNSHHYTLYFSSNLNEDLTKDSLKLAAVNKFQKIVITTAAEAVNEFSNANDTTWKDFVATNPLPESIDLTLRKEFIKRNEFDSVENLLKTLFPKAELQTFRTSAFFNIHQAPSNILVYKFIVF